LDAKARLIPSKDITGNLFAYKKLLELDPGNPRYKSKVGYYQNLLNEKHPVSKDTKPPSTKSRAIQSDLNWVNGGTLHDVTVAQWRAGSYRNKLATAGDWLAATTWKGHLNSPGDFDRMKTKARKLVNAVDESIKAPNIDHLSIAEIAGVLVTVANDLGP